MIGRLSINDCFFLGASLPVCAQNNVSDIDIEAILHKDGSMQVTQVWEGDFDDGTELYIPMNAPDYLTLHNLKVSDEAGDYEWQDFWDVDESFEEKANKCGLNYTKDGYEICFGISEYGHKRYKIEYLLKNVVGSYEDADGVNFRFVNKDMNTTPTEVQVEIRLADGSPITDDMADIWAFGYDGMVEFEDGAIVGYTYRDMDSDEHVTIMFSLEKGVLSPQRKEGGSFEEVKDKAIKDSDYEDKIDKIVAILVFVCMFFFVVVVPTLTVIGKMLKKKVRQKKVDEIGRRMEYFREIPNEGNLNASYVLGNHFEMCEEGCIMAVGIRLMDAFMK